MLAYWPTIAKFAEILFGEFKPCRVVFCYLKTMFLYIMCKLVAYVWKSETKKKCPSTRCRRLRCRYVYKVLPCLWFREYRDKWELPPVQSRWCGTLTRKSRPLDSSFSALYIWFRITTILPIRGPFTLSNKLLSVHARDNRHRLAKVRTCIRGGAHQPSCWCCWVSVKALDINQGRMREWGLWAERSVTLAGTLPARARGQAERQIRAR